MGSERKSVYRPHTAEPILAESRWERTQKELAEARRKREEEERRREEEYNRPLPEFLPKISRELRVHILSYVARVFNESARNVLIGGLRGILADRERHPWMYGDDIGHEVQWSTFDDKPVQEFSVAFRIAELKSMVQGGEREQIATVYVLHDDGGCYDAKLSFLNETRAFPKMVAGRLQRNLLKNFPALNSILGDWFETRMYTHDKEFHQLKKIGYQENPRENRVVHLEIF